MWEGTQSFLLSFLLSTVSFFLRWTVSFLLVKKKKGGKDGSLAADGILAGVVSNRTLVDGQGRCLKLLFFLLFFFSFLLLLLMCSLQLLFNLSIVCMHAFILALNGKADKQTDKERSWQHCTNGCGIKNACYLKAYQFVWSIIASKMTWYCLGKHLLFQLNLHPKQ